MAQFAFSLVAVALSFFALGFSTCNVLYVYALDRHLQREKRDHRGSDGSNSTHS